MEAGRNPELAAILARLSQQPPTTSRPLSEVKYAATTSIVPDAESSKQNTSFTENTLVSSAVDPRNRPAKLVVDPSKITEWRPAIKYVAESVYPNESLRLKIKQLIRSQHDHERRWWAERQALISKQGKRVERMSEADALLKAMGGVSATSTSYVGPEADETELKVLDKKIYASLKKLAGDIDRSLKSIGIPFYAVKHDLVILEEGTKKTEAEGRLHKAELRELQKRMLEHLEDLIQE